MAIRCQGYRCRAVTGRLEDCRLLPNSELIVTLCGDSAVFLLVPAVVKAVLAEGSTGPDSDLSSFMV